jgi:hypothetical protein
MKYFNRDGKHNFVDLNNVFVGYDSGQDCCENADWFIAEAVDVDPDICASLNQPQELEGFIFDPTFFVEASPESLDAGGVVIFRLVNSEGRAKYLHLFNSHNGYYRHGFEMDICGASFLDAHQVHRSGSI